MSRVLLASRVASALRELQECLRDQQEFEVHPRLISNGHTDPLHGLAFQPDIVVLHFDSEHMGELSEWASSAGRTRPPLIVVGSGGDTEALRMAIRSGAKDFLPQPVVAAELIAALQRVREEARKHARPAGTTGFVHAIVGAAGGAGTSFVATNLARILAGDDDSGGSPTMLVDMDLNFA